MQVPRALWLLAVVVLTGCAHVDAKGREVLRVGPLRGATVAPVDVDMKAADIDAGTDALTDEELAAIAAKLPAALSDAFDREALETGARRVGRARIEGCRLRAGKGKKDTVYEARCRVALVVDGVDVVEVHTEAIVTERPLLRPKEQEAPTTTAASPRNTQLKADDSERALVAALDAAARLLVERELPEREGGPKTAPPSRAEKAELARARLAQGGDPIAALFDIREAGAPSDAAAVVPFLADDDPKIRVAAIDALGELCAPASAEKLRPLVDVEEPVGGAAKRALGRIDACAKLGPG